MTSRYPLLIMALALGMTADADAQQQTGFLNRTVRSGTGEFKYQVYVPSNYSAAQPWPVILFLHGKGERGEDGLRPTMIALGAAIRANASRFPAIVVFPQVPSDSTWTGALAVAAMNALDQTMREFRTDPDRVYLTGLSMGGHGTWYLGVRYAERFAAIAPICAWITPGTTMPEAGDVVTDKSVDPFAAVADQLRNVPIWIFHGEMDITVPVSESRRAAAALQAAGADVRYTELPGTGHNAWDPAFASDAFVSWLFAQRRR